MNTLCNRCMYCIPVTVEHEKKKKSNNEIIACSHACKHCIVNNNLYLSVSEKNRLARFFK